MRITSVRHFPKRNVHSHHPVMQLDVDLEEADGVLTSQIDGFCDDLIGAFPTLKEHYCSRGYAGGFVERLREGTLLGHVLEHLILEMQSLVDCDVIYGKTRRIGTARYRIIAEYECEAVAEKAAEVSVKILNHLLERSSFDPRDAISEVQQVKARYGLGPSTRAIIEAAQRRGIPAMRLNEDSLVQLGYGCKQKKIQATVTGDTCCIGVDIASDKALCKKLLDESGIPVPEGFVVNSYEDLLAAAGKLDQGHLAIKPRRGNQGRGVSLDLSDEESWEVGYRLAQEIDDEVIVERFISGNQYRVLIVGDEVAAASLRLPPVIVGDGRSTIRELIERANSDPRRGDGHEDVLTKIPMDDLTNLTLSRQGLSLSSVPDEGQQVPARDGANLSVGGTAVDVTDDLHPETASLCCRAARVIGLDVAGVDLVASDISQPLDGGAIVEVNASPGLRMHQFPASGRPRDVAQTIVDHLFPQCSSGGRIPLIAVTGSNGKTTTTRLLHHILNEAGYHTAMTTTDGIYIGNDMIIEGDTTGPFSAGVVLRDPSVEAAVLETARGGIIRGGLAFDYCDVGIITNISSDHLGQDGVETLEDLLSVKSLVLETVPRWGRSVLNADDPRVMSVAERSLGETILFSLEPNNLSLMKHLNGGGSGVYVSEGRLLWARGRKVTPLIRLEDAPITFGGVVEHNVQNLAAAASGAIALGISPTTIRKAIGDFITGVNNPGRFEIYRLGERLIVVDYGHNAAGYAATFRALERLASGWHGVIGVPCNRRDRDIKAAARVAARHLSHIVVKEDRENPGRRIGEVASLLKSGALQAAHPEEHLKIFLDEFEAVHRALDELPGDGALVIFYEKYARVMAALKAWAQDHDLELEIENPRTGYAQGLETAAGMTSE